MEKDLVALRLRAADGSILSKAYGEGSLGHQPQGIGPAVRRILQRRFI